MFKRDVSENSQNPPRVFGPGSDVRERLEYQESILEELLTLMSAYLPPEASERVQEIQGRFNDNRRELERHQAIKVLNGQGEHASLEHYFYRFTSHEPADGQAFAFPNPHASIYNRLQELLARHVTRRHRELLLKGVGRRKLSNTDDIATCDNDFYTDVDGSLVLVMVTENVVAKWGIGPDVTLLQCAPAQTFFKRTNIEELITSLFVLLEGKYGFNLAEESPLTPDKVAKSLETHLPRQFRETRNITHRQPREFQNLALAPMGPVDREYDNLASTPMLLRVRHDPRTNGVEHVMLFRANDDGYMSFSISEGLTYWHYSSTEGLWVSVTDFMPYIPTTLFDKALASFFKTQGYTPQDLIEKTQVQTLARSYAASIPQNAVSRNNVVKLQANTKEKLNVVQVTDVQTQAQLVVILDDHSNTVEDVKVLDGSTGVHHLWEELNPSMQHTLANMLTSTNKVILK